MNRILILAALLAAGIQGSCQPAQWGGAWQKFECWPGINYRFAADAPWIDGPTHIMWVQIYNNYTVPISFNLRVVTPSDASLFQNGSKQTTDRIATLQPGMTAQSWNVVATPSPTATLYLVVDKMRFGGIDSWTAGGFATCGSNQNGPVPAPQNGATANPAPPGVQVSQQSTALLQPASQQPGSQQLAAQQPSGQQTQIAAENARRQAALQTYQQVVANNQQAAQQNRQDLNQATNAIVDIVQQNQADKVRREAAREQEDAEQAQKEAADEAANPCLRENLSNDEIQGCRLSQHCDDRYLAGLECLRNGDLQNAYSNMLMANLKHYSFHYDAHYYIGKINYYGWHGDINHSTPFMLQQGFDFYYRAAQGFAPAKYELGLLLWNGMNLWHGDFTITKDKNTALKLMRDAARDGVPEAILWVKDHKGNMYLKHPELTIPDVDPNFADNLVKTNVPIVPIVWPKN